MSAADKMLARVRKLLERAEHPNTGPEEAAACTAKAAAVMALHGVDEALAYAAAPADRREAPTSVRVPMPRPYSREKASLLSAVARACRCRTVHHNWGREVEAVTVFGFRSDLDRVAVLFASLLVQAVRGLAAPGPYWVEGNALAAYRRSWLVGFAQECELRLSEAERDAASATGTELVFVGREAAVADAVADAFPNLQKARARRLSGEGYRDGRQAGRAADIGAGRLGVSGRAAIGGGRG